VRTIVFTLAALALATSLALPVHGQERSWTVSVFADAGGIIPIRTLGKNAGALQERPEEQVISEFENAMTVGGGVEVGFPASQIRIRASYHTTPSGSVIGRLAFCGDPDTPLVTGGVCQQVNADARLHTLGADLSFVRGSPDSWLRPVIFLGLALRKYEIGGFECPFSEDAEYNTCGLLDELWSEEGGFAPTLRFGVGFDADLGPLQLRTSVLDNVGRYPGGAGSADGHAQNDITISAGLAVRVF
jgi:hypothetical protein